jgi:hypothetical protein
MPFPKFSYCIVCDALRPELAGKATILGFYGLAPNVNILMVKVGQILPVCFVIGFPPVAAQELQKGMPHYATITGPSGRILTQTPPGPINAGPGAPIVLALNCVFPTMEQGKYVLSMYVGDELVDQTSITIREATAEEIEKVKSLGIGPL